MNAEGNRIISFGRVAGLFSAGSSATIEVPSGPKRIFHILGLKLINGSCEAFRQPGFELTWANYTAPYLLASATADISPGDNQLNIQLQNAFQAANRIEDCNFESGSTPPSGSEILQVSYPTLPPTTTYGNNYSVTFTLQNISADHAASSLIQNVTNSAFSIGSSTCGSELAPGASCQVTVNFIPNRTGGFGGAIEFTHTLKGDPRAVLRSLSSNVSTYSMNVTPTYSGQSNWNDYVTSASPVVSPIACTGTETNYDDCRHAGEWREVRIPKTTFSCDDLNFQDSEGVLNWTCQIDSDPTLLLIRSIGFQPGKSLRNLINFTTGTWIPLKLAVSFGAMAIAESPVSSWWSNPIVTLSNTGMTLDSPGTVYIVPTTFTPTVSNKGYHINADRVAFVTAAGSKIIVNNSPTAATNCNVSGETASPTVISLFCIGAQKFIWLEANADFTVSNSFVAVLLGNTSTFVQLRDSQLKFISGTISPTAVNVVSSRANSIIRTTLEGFNTGLYLNTSARNYVGELRVDGKYKGTNSAGIRLAGSGGTNFNFLEKVRVHRTDYGISLEGPNSATNNKVTEFQISNTKFGLYLENNTKLDNVFHNGLIAASGESVTNGYGIRDGGSLRSRFSHISIVGATEHGVSMYYATDSQFNQMLIANADRGFYISGGSTRFSQVSSITSSGLNSFRSDNSPVIAGSGANQYHAATGCNWMGLLDCPATGGTFTSISITSSADFVGRTSDAANQTLGAGALGTLGSVPYNTITDWLTFSNQFRTWGRSVTDFTSSLDFRDRMAPNSTTEPMAIIDFRTRITAPFYHRSGNGSSSNSNFTVGAACPTAVTSYSLDEFSTPYLHNAAEILKDGIGNDNGYCESNEACLYSPNYGYYQGEGSYLGRSCVYSPSVGGPTGVTIFARPSFGI